MVSRTGVSGLKNDEVTVKEDHASMENGRGPRSDDAVWGFWGTLLWGLLIGVIFVAVQSMVVATYVNTTVDGDPDQQEELLYQQAITDGDVLSWATIASALVCTVLTLLAVAFKPGSDVKRYLGLYSVGFKPLAKWTALFIILLIGLDVLTNLLDRPVTPDVMREIYASTDNMLVLFAGIVVAASVFEELFFRGFLMEGFSRTFIGPWGAIVLSAAFWSLVHLQYDLYGIATIFVIGLFLGLAKLRSGSTLFAIALHALNNGIAFFVLMALMKG